MTVGVCQNQAIWASLMQNKTSNDGKVASYLDLNNNISQQVIEQFSKYYSDVKKYDRPAIKNNPSAKLSNFIGNPNVIQEAVDYAFTPISWFQSFSSNRESEDNILTKLLQEIDNLIQKCYSGNQAAFKKLIDLSKGTSTAMGAVITNTTNLNEVTTKAKNAVYKLIDEAPDYPNMFQMMTESGLLDEKEFGDSANLPAKLINEAASSSKAMQQLKKLISSGTFRLEDYVDKAIELDPNSAVATLVDLSQSNISKDQKLTIANTLSEVATNNPGSQAGMMAAKGLKKIIKSEGQNSILAAAFEGLTKAAMAGNNEALKSLEDLVTDPTISKNKAMKAVESLTKVASNGSASGGQATKILVGLANNKRLAPQIREKVVDGLTEIASSGNGNAALASDGLLELAKLPQDKIGKKALTNLMSLKNTGIMDQGKLTEVMKTAATSNKTDTPLKKLASNRITSSKSDSLFNNKSELNNNTNVFKYNNNLTSISFSNSINEGKKPKLFINSDSGFNNTQQYFV
ncbi:MAG: hypothetical protein AB1782_20810 [Cyanobacteriota bacterium]